MAKGGAVEGIIPPKLEGTYELVYIFIAGVEYLNHLEYLLHFQ